MFSYKSPVVPHPMFSNTVCAGAVLWCERCRCYNANDTIDLADGVMRGLTDTAIDNTCRAAAHLGFTVPLSRCADVLHLGLTQKEEQERGPLLPPPQRGQPDSHRATIPRRRGALRR